MPTQPSKLPKQLTQGYWIKVRQLLRTRRRLSMGAAIRATKAYRAVLARDRVQDEIYHAPVEDTAKGIVQGGYAVCDKPKAEKSTTGAGK